MWPKRVSSDIFAISVVLTHDLLVLFDCKDNGDEWP